MFENLSHQALQQYWWVIISLLGSILVFLMFVQGGQMLINLIGKTSEQRTMLINTVGRKWDLTFTISKNYGPIYETERGYLFFRWHHLGAYPPFAL